MNNNKFSLKTIEEGRLSPEKMGKLVGGSVSTCLYNCNSYTTSECRTYYVCTELPAVTFQACYEGIGYRKCSTTYTWSAVHLDTISVPTLTASVMASLSNF